MNPGRKWICAVVALLAGNILATVALITLAHHGASRVLPDYYQRAVHYEDAIDQADRNHTLAWHVAVTVHDGTAVVTATDRLGQPIEHASVHLAGFERSATARTIDSELVASRAGEYRARVAGAGWLDLAVTIDRGADHYVHQLALETLGKLGAR